MFFAVLSGDMSKGRPGGLMDTLVSWNSLAALVPEDGDLKFQILLVTAIVRIIRTVRLLVR